MRNPNRYVVQRRYAGITAKAYIWKDMSRPFKYSVDAYQWLQWEKEQDKSGKPFRIIKIIHEE